MATHVNTLTSKCEGCARLGRERLNQREPKNFDAEVPHRIGERILIDEITRTKESYLVDRVTRAKMKDLTSTWKFLFATDSLSRYSILLPIQSKSITSDKLKDLILKAKDFICQGQLGDTNVTILHMDNWSVHQGLIDDETLKSAKINLEIKQRTSCSKNYLALIDGRIQKISPILNKEMSIASATKEGVARNTTIRYNSTRGPEGLSPGEIFTGRDGLTGGSISIDIKSLRQKIIEKRAATRESKYKSDKKGRKPPIRFVPWREGMAYTDRENMPIKIGDKILLDRPYDKNNLRPFYKICSSVKYPLGIDFDEKICSTVHEGTNEKTVFYWQLDWISKIVEGEYIKNNDSDIIGAQIFI